MGSTKRVLAAAACVCVWACAPAASAGPAIDPAHKFTWQENCGYLNWSGAPGQGVLLARTYLSGYIWSENIGWISLGHGPKGAQHYGNTSQADYGVNMDVSGNLSGFAWSENAGWLNFSGGAEASPPNPARFDHAAHRFRGFAWGENIGWANLDDANVYVGVLCPADFNTDGMVTVNDIFSFLTAWFSALPAADFNRDGRVSVQDIFDFLTAWFSGC